MLFVGKCIKQSLSSPRKGVGRGEKRIFFLHVKFDALSIPQCGPKVCGGENGAAAGARMSRLTLVISLESKLINKF